MGTSVHALIGADAFLQLEALHALLRKQPAGTARVDYDGETAALADVLDELRSFSMFSAVKVVVVRSADDFISKHRSAMEAYVAAPSDSATLVLRCTTLPSNQRIYKLIDKHGVIEKCEPPKDRDVARWVIDRAKQAHHLRVQPGAAQKLADLIGADLGRLDNELSKLALQVDDAAVSEADVGKGVVFQRDQEMWQMTDELTRGRTDAALRRWRQLLHSDPSSEFRAVTWLTMWLEKATRALALKQQRMSTPAIAKELRIWPASNAEPLLQTASQLGPAGLRGAMNLLAELDLRSKSGRGDARDNVERFILWLGK